MKVIQFKAKEKAKVNELLLMKILQRDFNAFKATSKQFIRNNQTYFSGFSGMIA